MKRVILAFAFIALLSAAVIYTANSADHSVRESWFAVANFVIAGSFLASLLSITPYLSVEIDTKLAGAAGSAAAAAFHSELGVLVLSVHGVTMAAVTSWHMLLWLTLEIICSAYFFVSLYRSSNEVVDTSKNVIVDTGEFERLTAPRDPHLRTRRTDRR